MRRIIFGCFAMCFMVGLSSSAMGRSGVVHCNGNPYRLDDGYKDRGSGTIKCGKPNCKKGYTLNNRGKFYWCAKPGSGSGSGSSSSSGKCNGGPWHQENLAQGETRCGKPFCGGDEPMLNSTTKQYTCPPLKCNIKTDPYHVMSELVNNKFTGDLVPSHYWRRVCGMPNCGTEPSVQVRQDEMEYKCRTHVCGSLDPITYPDGKLRCPLPVK